MYHCTHSPLEGCENKLRDGNEGNVNAVEKRLEYIRAVNGALRMPTSLRIDVLHSMGLSIRDYSVSPSEQLRVRALPRSPWPIEASASKRGESLHAPDGMPSLLGYGYLKRGRYTPSIFSIDAKNFTTISVHFRIPLTLRETSTKLILRLAISSYARHANYHFL